MDLNANIYCNICIMLLIPFNDPYLCYEAYIKYTLLTSVSRTVIVKCLVLLFLITRLIGLLIGYLVKSLITW
jgi:hypothetical protein